MNISLVFFCVVLHAVARKPVCAETNSSSTVHPRHVSLGFGAYTSLPSLITSNPAVVSLKRGKQNVFARGSDSRLWNTELSNNGFKQWEPIGDHLMRSDPAAIAREGDLIDVFYLGLDHFLYQVPYSNGTWHDFIKHEVRCMSAPAVTSSSSGVLDVFALDFNSSLLWKRIVNGVAEHGQLPLDGWQFTSKPAVTSNGLGDIHIYARGLRMAFHLNSYVNGSWTGWSLLGVDGVHVEAPTVSSVNHGTHVVLGVGRNSIIYQLDDRNWRRIIPDADYGRAFGAACVISVAENENCFSEFFVRDKESKIVRSSVQYKCSDFS